MSMRILLGMNLPYYPAYGGANKANKFLLEGLAEKGHTVRAVVPVLGTPSPITHEQFLEKLAQQSIAVSSAGGVHRFTMNGVEVRAAVEASRLRSCMVEQIESFRPDWVLVSSENPSQNLLDAAVKTPGTKVACVVQAPEYLPFGPESFYPSARRTELFSRADLIIAISQYTADYLKRWSSLNPKTIYMPVYGSGPFPNYGRFDEGYVTLVNPCQLKGISIFCALAREFPDVAFAAVPTWGTTPADLETLAALPNVRLLEASLDIDHILAQTRILLMPSLAPETLGQTAIDSMLRGIPVLASNLGGLPEAKMGIDFVIPVNPIELYKSELDENGLPVAILPDQDIRPWRDALSSLLTSRRSYDDLSAASREAALRFVSGVSVDNWEDALINSRANGKAHHTPQQAESRGAASDGADALEVLSDLTPEQLALAVLQLRKMSKQRAAGQNGTSRIRPVPRSHAMPVSFAQQRLWFLHQLDPDSEAFNQPAAIRLRGVLDKSALDETITQIVRRHETLRTTFTAIEGVPHQVINPAAEIRLPVIDLTAMEGESRERELVRLAAEESRRPFSLATGPLLRVTLVKLGEDDHAIFFTTHHIVSDGWSMGVLVREVTRLYEAIREGRGAELEELEVQYADYAAWQREWMSGEVMDEQVRYWRGQLEGAPPLLDLPTDRPRMQKQSLKGANHTIVIEAELVEKIRKLSNSENVTLFMTLLAAFQTLLFRYTRQPVIMIGTPIAGRNHIEVEGLIGFFINTLVLRGDLAGHSTFRELLVQAREVTLGAYSHQELPFEKLVEVIQPERSTSHTPIFQVLFSLNNVPESTLELPGLTLSPLGGGYEVARYDLALYLTEIGQEILASMQYSSDLFEEATIERMLGHFRTLLEALAESPGEPISKLRLSTADERHQLLSEFNQAMASF